MLAVAIFGTPKLKIVMLPISDVTATIVIYYVHALRFSIAIRLTHMSTFN